MKKCRFNYKQYFIDNLSYKEEHFPKMKMKKLWCFLQQIRMIFRWNLRYSEYYVRFYYDRKHWIKDLEKRPIHNTQKLEDRLLRRSERRRRFSYVTNNVLLRPLFLILVPIAYVILVVGVVIASIIIPILLLVADLKINDGRTISWISKKNKVK